MRDVNLILACRRNTGLNSGDKVYVENNNDVRITEDNILDVSNKYKKTAFKNIPRIAKDVKIALEGSTIQNK